MTTADQLDRAVADPIGLITDLVADVENDLDSEIIRTVVTSVAGSRAKSRNLAKDLAIRPAVLTDGRSPAPRAVGDLLIELRKAGASAIAPPVCAECGKKLRTLQRKGQDWYCGVCGQETAECTTCGNTSAEPPPETGPPTPPRSASGIEADPGFIGASWAARERSLPAHE